MKVLMSTDAVGGVWTYATELRAALARHGVEVVPATLGPKAPPTVGGGPYRRCRLEWEPDPWQDVASSRAWLQELAEHERVDLVHLNGYAHGARPWPVPVVVVGHSCVLSWHEAVRGAPAGPAWERYRREVAAGLRGADVVVAPTQAMRAALHRHYGDEHRCRVIANGVSPHPADPARGAEALVLGAGRLWDAAKGLDTLDAAAALIDWPVVVAGAAGDAPAGHVHLLGELDRQALRRRMGRAAIFAHPARYEPFGLAVLEAALAGCALVLGDIPSLREQWDGIARFVAPGDARELAGALQELIDDEPLRRACASLARERAQQQGAETMARRYADLYERVCAHARPEVLA